MKRFSPKFTSLLFLAGFAVAFFAGAALFGDFVFAQGDTFGLAPVDDGLNLAGGDIRTTVARIIRAALTFLGVVAVAIVLYGGYMYMTSGGNEQKIETAKKILINGGIGLAIILMSWVITQFVINQLSEAVNPAETEEGCDGSIEDCNGPDNPFGSCIENFFVAKSVTPSQEVTNMNNIVIRAVFTQSVGTAPEEVFTITASGQDATSQFEYSYVEGTDQRVLQALYSVDDSECNEENKQDGQNCLPVSPDEYIVTINENVVSTDDKPIEKDEICDGFQTVESVEFRVNKQVNDITPAVVGDIFFVTPDGVQSGDSVKLVAGTTYPVQVDVTDTSGVGYVNMNVDGEGEVFDAYDGPHKDESSAALFAFEYPLVIGNKTVASDYTLTINAYDIDHNLTSKEIVFAVVPPHCANGEPDPEEGETGVDVGGPCGGGEGDSCEKNSDCGIGLMCLDNVCTSKPLIQKISPQDGRPGNWVSIIGKHFGTTPGVVSFVSDLNGNNKYEDDTWVDAELVQCAVGDSWQDTYAVVEVPGGNVGGAAAFGAANNPASSDAIFSFGQAATLEAWVKNATNGTILMFTAAGDPNARVLRIHDGKVLAMTDWGPNWPALSLYGASVDPDVFTHLVMTVDEKNILKVYVNGSLSSEKELPAVEPFDATMSLGGKNGYSWTNFTGVIDEAAVYDTALSADQIQEHYQAGIAGTSHLDFVNYQDLVLSDQPIGYWSLNEDAGTTVADTSENGNTLAYENSTASLVPGIFGSNYFGSAAIFDGKSTGLQPASNPLYNVNGAFSFSFWVKPEPFKPLGVIVSGGLSNEHGWSVHTTPDPAEKEAVITFELSDPSIGGHRAVSEVLALDNEWHHIAGGFDPALEEMVIYVDGNKRVDDDVHNPYIGQATGNVLSIGRRAVPSPHSYTGALDEMALFNGLLTDEQVQLHVENGKDSNTFLYKETVLADNPALYLRFSDPVVDMLTGEVAEFTPDVGAFGSLPSLDTVGIFGTLSDLGKLAAIRIQRGDNVELFDLSTDDFGIKPVPEDNPEHPPGLFVFNDIERPGLCSVATAKGETVAEPDTPVVAHGKSFGETQGAASFLSFGGVSANVTSWSDVFIQTKVPLNMTSGEVGVFVEVDGEKSNALPFTVDAGDLSSLKPIIESILPSSTTKGSFVTITGQNFGNTTGIVYFTTKSNATCTTNNADCIKGVQPTSCDNAWKNKQIVIQVPDDLESQSHFVIVERGDNKLQSDGTDSLGIEDGPARPGICSLEPDSGPAPLPEGEFLTLKGVNFSPQPKVYFWKKDADLDNLGTWFSSDDGNTILTKNIAGTELTTEIPTKSGASMPPNDNGFIVVTDKDGVASNPVTYEVADCTLPDSVAPGEHLQCCTEGPEAGQWKDENFLCEGDVRESGYVWRFSSGLIPDLPKVVEQCDVEKWDDPAAKIAFPSPTPWEKHSSNAPVCTNARVGVRFTVGMDTESFPGNVNVYTCAETAFGNIDCDSKKEAVPSDELTLGYQSSGSQSVLIIRDNTEGNLQENTWYHVEISDAVQSTQVLKQLNIEETKHFPLQKTKPCGPGTAYCFDFKTSDTECTLSGAFIDPPKYTADKLGVLQDPKYPYEDLLGTTGDAFAPPSHPLYYFIGGKGNEACIAMNADGLGWDWGTSNISKAESENAPGTVNKLTYTDSRAVVTALEDTGANPVDVFAKTEITVANATTTLQPESELNITLGPPRVINYAPNCTSSCVNASIIAIFNRHMDPATYADGFSLYRCAEAACTNTTLVPNNNYNINVDSHFKLEVDNTTHLEQNTYYKVVLSDAIKSLTKLDPPEQGESLEPFTWIFRTKDDGTPCVASKLIVEPDPFTAYAVGQKTKYVVTPYSSPNECSSFGQALNKWDYGYDWSMDSANGAVAKIENFDTEIGWKPYCSVQCLPAGSDITLTNFDTIYTCGNGKQEPGEDCDNPNDIGCSINCTYTNEKKVELGLVGSDPFSEFDSEKAQSWCGDGNVEAGESCDLGISLANAEADPNIPLYHSAVGCSASCLHVGTPVTKGWCTTQASITNQLSPTCLNDAISVCGNGIKELGEECEIGVDGADQTTCSDSCLLQDVCGVPGLAQCDPAEDEGCNDDCTLSGSSLFFKKPSICGDGVFGTGEWLTCENLAFLEDDTPGNSPVQLVTALGKGQETSPGKQETDVIAKLSTNTTVVDTADYTLQCGYEEFEKKDDNGQYNNCLGNASTNNLGVGFNTCCAPRPARTDQYPADKQGFSDTNTEAACLNTYIEVTFDKQMSPDSLLDGVNLVRGYTDPAHVCAGTDVTTEMNGVLQLTQAGDSEGFFKKIWNGVKTFFVNLFKNIVFAGTYDGTDVDDIQVWCAGEITTTQTPVYDYNDDGEVISTRVVVSIGDLLDPQAIYAVLLRGGLEGIKDIDGVGIKSAHAESTSRDDMWMFKTGTEICKVAGLGIAPEAWLYSKPNTEKLFVAQIENDSGQLIQEIPGKYEWELSWQPENPVFVIEDIDALENAIAVQNAPGSLTAVTQLTVVEDIFADANQKDKTFSAFFDLDAFFCENPWQASGAWKQDAYNFSMKYCADAGAADSLADDLPYLKELEIADSVSQIEQKISGSCETTGEICHENSECPAAYTMNDGFVLTSETGKTCLSGDPNLPGNVLSPPSYGKTYVSCSVDEDCVDEGAAPGLGICRFIDTSAVGTEAPNTCVGAEVVTIDLPEQKLLDEDVLKKYFFFNDSNPDAVGVQIFSMGEALDLDEWFAEHQIDTAEFSDTAVDGYPAKTDGSNYYIEALNYVEDESDLNNSKIYTNIYLFSVNPDADGTTRNVFEQLIDSLEFNTNLTDFGMCLSATADTVRTTPGQIVNVSCATDFDCRYTSGDYKDGTNGMCSNAKTKFFRDLDRTVDIRAAQDAISSYLATDVALPDFNGHLQSGTFVPGYTVSRWPSWGMLGGLVQTGLAVDPINEWTECDAPDQQTCWNHEESLYVCPAFSSVYEYEYLADTDDYVFHAPLEFFNQNDQIIIDRVDTSAYSSDPVCTSGQQFSPFSGSCGDGVVGFGEVCDPPGSTTLGDYGHTGPVQGTCAYADKLKQVSCNVDTDCPVSEFDNGALVSNDSGVKACMRQKEGNHLLYSSINAGNEMNVFLCNSDAECQEPKTYGDVGTTVISINEPNAPYTIGGPDFDSKYRCDRLVNMDAFKGSGTLSCLGASSLGPLGNCDPGEKALSVCNTTCSAYTYGSCKPPDSICGNNVVEGIETCDDGALNGQYGHCNETCDGLSEIGYCGNGVQDGAYEFCDIVDDIHYALDLGTLGSSINKKIRFSVGTDIAKFNKYIYEIEQCQELGDCASQALLAGAIIWSTGDAASSNYHCSGDPRLVCDPSKQHADCNAPADITWDLDFSKVNDLPSISSSELTQFGECVPGNFGTAYNAIQSFSCAWNCSTYGAYCGDGIVQTEYGEECEDGNFDNNDGCTSTCIKPKLCGGPYGQSQSCLVSADCPVVGMTQNAQFILKKPTDTVCFVGGDILYAGIKTTGELDVISCDIQDGDQSGIGNCADQSIYPVDFIENDGTIYSYDFDSPLPYTYDNGDFFLNNIDCKPIGDSGGSDEIYNASCTPPVLPVCGNGKLEAGEECDDGNSESGDTCSPSCQFTEIAVSCGDGVVQDATGEVCDLGDQNGIPCNPAYGESCTYCGQNCKNILTVDSSEFCGDGIVNGDEKCDVAGELVVEAGSCPYQEPWPLDAQTLATWMCITENPDIKIKMAHSKFPHPDTGLFKYWGRIQTGDIDEHVEFSSPKSMGEYNDAPSELCNKIHSTFIDLNASVIFGGGYCDSGPEVPGSSVYDSECRNFKEGIAYTNKDECAQKLFGLSCIDYEKGGYTCTNNCQTITNTCVSCDVKQIADGAPNLNVTIINPLVANGQKGPIKAGTQRMSLYTSAPSPSDDVFKKILMELFPIASSIPDPVLPRLLSETQSIETDLQCNGDYDLFFNVEFLNKAKYSMTDANAKLEKVDDLVDDGAIGAFDFPVANQYYDINHPLVLSPSMPEGVFRVVLTWDEVSGAEQASFGGLVYNEDLSDPQQSPEDREVAAVSYLEAKANLDDYGLCNNMYGFSEWWSTIPGVNSWFPVVNVDLGDVEDDFVTHCNNGLGIMPSEIVRGTGKYVQSFTIDTKNLNTLFNDVQSTEPFAFLAQSFNGATIAKQKSANVEVLVYGHHPNQDIWLSYYPPIAQFKLSSAQATNNPGAKYWHVFNLERDGAGDYQVTFTKDKEPNGTIIGDNEHGSIESNFCQVLENIPGAKQCDS